MSGTQSRMMRTDCLLWRMKLGAQDKRTGFWSKRAHAHTGLTPLAACTHVTCRARLPWLPNGQSIPLYRCVLSAILCFAATDSASQQAVAGRTPKQCITDQHIRYMSDNKLFNVLSCTPVPMPPSDRLHQSDRSGRPGPSSGRRQHTGCRTDPCPGGYRKYYIRLTCNSYSICPFECVRCVC